MFNLTVALQEKSGHYEIHLDTSSGKHLVDVEIFPWLKSYHFVLIMATPVDQSGSLSTAFFHMF